MFQAAHKARLEETRQPKVVVLKDALCPASRCGRRITECHVFGAGRMALNDRRSMSRYDEGAALRHAKLAWRH
jgi:hypothetical protein